MRRAGLIFAMLVFVAMPVGAGASGHASLAMLGFAGLFLLGNAVMRPTSVRLDAPGDLAVQAVTAAAFAALLVGLGQSLRALAGIEGRVELFGWLFAGAWALVLARIVWPPGLTDRAARSAEAALREVHRAGERAREEAAETDHRATEQAVSDRRAAERKGATHRPAKRGAERRSGERRLPPRSDPRATPRHTRDRSIDAPPAMAEAASTDPAPSPDSPADDRARPGATVDPELQPAFAALDALPETASAERVRASLREVAGAGPPDRVFAALVARAAPDRPRRDRRALLLHALDTSLAMRRRGAGEAAAAFEAIVAAADAAALADFVALADALLDADAEARADMPGVARLIEIADQIEDNHEDQAEALISLAHRIEDLALEAENGADA
ncbi:hypothetical protein DLJ49_02155 [Rhodovulum sp. 12E13]|uniref:hypothetical protein n=1 Tax=Rhodovulum sp. 12E13 TaxID=2203891 RepID=UPI000E1A8C95|nr:hypothetical protein [Rhodovulum sp. 12E13]RDC74808.1 hypothetical protein DLJ49_02155 [Rhodovulum sp. 12E13]